MLQHCLIVIRYMFIVRSTKCNTVKQASIQTGKFSFWHPQEEKAHFEPFEWLGMARNGSEWSGLARNGLKWPEMARNSPEWPAMSEWEFSPLGIPHPQDPFQFIPIPFGPFQFIPIHSGLFQFISGHSNPFWSNQIHCESLWTIGK
jgi:hypothetical protein